MGPPLCGHSFERDHKVRGPFSVVLHGENATYATVLSNVVQLKANITCAALLFSRVNVRSEARLGLAEAFFFIWGIVCMFRRPTQCEEADPPDRVLLNKTLHPERE